MSENPADIELSGVSPSLSIDSVFDDRFQDVVFSHARLGGHKTIPPGKYRWLLKGLV